MYRIGQLSPLPPVGQPWVWLSLSSNLKPEIKAKAAIPRGPENSLALGLLTYTSLRSDWAKVPPSWEEAQEESWRKLSAFHSCGVWKGQFTP